MKEIIIKSYDEIVRLIENITKDKELMKTGGFGYYFRGQANKDWRLLPGLLRNTTLNEIDEMKNLPNINEKDKSSISLAVAQHYGKSTRCLDFTRNFNIALFFACNPAYPYFNSDGALFVLEKQFHKPTWFTNYFIYYTATNTKEDVSSWEYANYLSKIPEIESEFIRTGRSTTLDSYDLEAQIYLSRGFLVDFKDNDLGFERIKRQEAALFYFGSKFYVMNGKNEKVYIPLDRLTTRWSSQNLFRFEPHNIVDSKLEEFCPYKIIIPQRIKKEIFDKINIAESDLGL